MTDSGRIEARITVPTGGWDIAVTDSGGGPETITIPAGTYYQSSADSGSRDLAAELTHQLNANATLAATYTVSIALGEDGQNSCVIIASGGGTPTITWTDTDPRDLLGFAGNLSGGAIYTSTLGLRAQWRGVGSAQQTLYGNSDAGAQESDRRSVVGPTGQTYNWVGNQRVFQSLRWEGVKHRYVRVAGESTTNESFERFWIDNIGPNAQGWAEGTLHLRWYPDADTDGTHYTYHALGLESLFHTPMRQNWLGAWSIELPRLYQVPT